MMTYLIPARPVGINNAYKTRRGGGRFLSQEAKDFKKLVSDIVDPIPFDPDSQLLDLEISLYFSEMLKKNGKWKSRRFDLDGHVKFLIDALCEAWGIDDAFIANLILYKRPGNDSCVIVARTIAVNSN
jgi:Holliday junction resolvase RusA-like endonuclease